MWTSRTQNVAAPRSTPQDTCILAVGDVHGHAAELLALQQVIARDAMESRQVRKILVYLGDYIDRGPEVREALELLAVDRALRDGIERVHLVGNHDQFLVELLNGDPELDREFLVMWYENGGHVTMKSLGVEGYGRLMDAGNIGEISKRTAIALGPDLIAFLKGLRASHREGDYVFVHAGIDPKAALDAQDFSDLLMIREPFLSGTDWSHPFCVVHGHSISMPTVHSHRIGVDAGCYKNGALCAVQIEGDQVRFLGVTREPDFPWNERLGGRDGEWVWAEQQDVC